jgi:hypothetical protein
LIIGSTVKTIWEPESSHSLYLRSAGQRVPHGKTAHAMAAIFLPHRKTMPVGMLFNSIGNITDTV